MNKSLRSLCQMVLPVAMAGTEHNILNTRKHLILDYTSLFKLWRQPPEPGPFYVGQRIIQVKQCHLFTYTAIY